MQVQITTRIEDDVAEVLQAIANREKRSLSAQLAVIVEKFIAEQREAEQQKAA